MNESMNYFINCIQVSLGPDKIVFYLTDKEIFSSKGKHLFSKSKPGYVFSHDAISNFFGLSSKEGINCGKQYFWDRDYIPKEIANKIKNFDLYWGKMFERSYFDEDNLLNMLYEGTRKWKNKASEQILKQCPTSFNLLQIIQYGTKKYKRKAIKEILKQSPDNVAYIIHIEQSLEYAPSQYKGPLAEHLLKQKVSEQNLLMIILFAPTKYKDIAWARLKDQGLSKDTLLEMICFLSDKWASQAWEQLMKQNPSSDGLNNIVIHGRKKWVKKAEILLTSKEELLLV